MVKGKDFETIVSSHVCYLVKERRMDILGVNNKRTKQVHLERRPVITIMVLTDVTFSVSRQEYFSPFLLYPFSFPSPLSLI